jgi:hypothetical protein
MNDLRTESEITGFMISAGWKYRTKLQEVKDLYVIL